MLISINPIHDNRPTNKGAERSGTEIAVKAGHAGEENRAVEEVEFGFWETAVKRVDDEGCYCADEEAVGDGFEEGEGEEPFWSLRRFQVSELIGFLRCLAWTYHQHVLDTRCQRRCDLLSSPLVIRIVDIAI